MRKLIGMGTAMVLTLIFAQAAYAVYNSAGPVSLSTSNPSAGGSISISACCYMPRTMVTFTIESEPVVLGTATADADGEASMTAIIPAGFSGSHEIVATGVAPDNSVLVLSSPITVGGSALPNTSMSAPTSGVSPLLTALTVLGVVVVSAGALFFARGRREE